MARSIAGEGTRFLLFSQAPFVAPGRPPARVTLPIPRGSIAPGPADERIYVVDPVGRRHPYGLSMDPRGRLMERFPPWLGAERPPVAPALDGHFDHLDPSLPEFEAAHVFAAVHFALDCWEDYLGGPVTWHFARDYDRLEIVLNRDLDNATAGWGFLEVGADFPPSGPPRSFALNFDVLAHETGHLIVYATVGLPLPEAESGEYLGFHESAADLVALLAAARLEPVIDELFAMSRGNLYLLNELNRFAELSASEQIRIASNARRLDEFAAGWTSEHELSEPLTGAVFDILVDLFHESLLEHRLISPTLEELADLAQDLPALEPVVQDGFDRAYSQDPAAFRDVFAASCDRLGGYLAFVLGTLSPDRLAYADVGQALLVADLEASGGRYSRLIDNSLSWRGIGHVRVGPHLAAPDGDSHVRSVRTLVPNATPQRRFMPYSRRRAAAQACRTAPLLNGRK